MSRVTLCFKIKNAVVVNCNISVTGNLKKYTFLELIKFPSRICYSKKFIHFLYGGDSLAQTQNFVGKINQARAALESTY
jgi:hypothetical protein